MFLKRIVGGAALLAALLTSGCYSWRESWCERHCGCRSPYPSGYYAPPPAYAPPAQPQCCVPCCCTPVNYGPQQTGSWSAPQPNNGCCR